MNVASDITEVCRSTAELKTLSEVLRLELCTLPGVDLTRIRPELLTLPKLTRGSRFTIVNHESHS